MTYDISNLKGIVLRRNAEGGSKIRLIRPKNTIMPAEGQVSVLRICKSQVDLSREYDDLSATSN